MMNLKPIMAAAASLLLSGALAFAAPDDDPFVYSADDSADSELLSDAWANVQEDGGEALDAAAAINDPQMTTEQKLEELVIRFLVNLLACWVIVGFFYYRKARRRDYYFTFLVFSVAMQMLLYVMGSVSVGVGLTLGLFAIFGVIRYRTETVPIREMTYLFVIIAVAAMNGLAPLYDIKGSFGEEQHYALLTGNMMIIILANLLIIGVIAVLENGHIVHHMTTKLVLYDRIENIVPEKRAELIADLGKRLGVEVKDVEIGHVDFLKDAAFIKVFYELGKGESNTINTITREKDYIG
ncbi:MAG: DUF4956 domain-containing protein [Bacteroidota bacterium]|nr:DUF4956 domain-containing protein [Bacteroidota bacterium]